jgi:hypothetical protein
MGSLEPTGTAGAIFAIFQPGDENPNRKVGDAFRPAYKNDGRDLYESPQAGAENPNRKVGDAFRPAYKNDGRVLYESPHAGR